MVSAASASNTWEAMFEQQVMTRLQTNTADHGTKSNMDPKDEILDGTVWTDILDNFVRLSVFNTV